MDDLNVVCLVAAAGRGLRFGREIPKSFYPVEGKSLLARSLTSLSAYGGISRFVVMVPSGWEDKALEQIPAGGKGFEVVAGGCTRQESVEIGLSRAGDADVVLIHDACRPFVSTGLIDRVVMAAASTGAAVPVLQATDTLARLRGEDLEAIIPRDRVVMIQTPQGFRPEVLRKAYETTPEEIRASTDESSLVLAANMPVKAVEGERWNLKVTVREDLEITRAFLSEALLDTGDPGGEGPG